MKPLVVIRPQPGCDATLKAARALGLEAHGFPLFEIHPHAWEPPQPDEVDALLVGSANAFRHASHGLWAFRSKPAYVVGARTAEAARAGGFEVVAIGEAGLQSLFARLQSEHRRLLRPGGRKRVELHPPPGVTVLDHVVYSSAPLPMPAALAELLRRPAVVMLHSREAALHFVTQCDAHGLDRSRIALALIGPRLVDATPTPSDPEVGGWGALAVAEAPDEPALLALAARMCQEPDGSEKNGLMEAEVAKPVEATPLGTHEAVAAPLPLSSELPRRKRSLSGLILVAVLAFGLGAALVTWVAARGYLDRVLLPDRAGAGRDTATSAAGGTSSEQASGLAAVGTVEARLAMVEDRLSRLNLQAEAAAGNATRAEGLLVAFATRRMIDRGQPLRHLSDQLRLRFSNSQPRAVATVVEFAQDPVTLDQLSARLEALAPELTERSSDESFWSRASRELSGLFVVRHEASAPLNSQARLDNARVMLTAGRVSQAIDRVSRMPGAEAADKWIADARRYAAAQAALDLIETAAMLEPARAGNATAAIERQPGETAAPVPAN
ncbi:MAG TPA: uroporphyrinogen-III synthase [Novosphingobium sp.]|nr:uroporphyrinogen-III synthase [Novosphingobium sp.]